MALKPSLKKSIPIGIVLSLVGYVVILGPDGLQKLLKPLAGRGISMSKIESRPSRRGVWEYVFFIDIEGHKDAPVIAEALHDIEHETAMLRILGSYPKAVL